MTHISPDRPSPDQRVSATPRVASRTPKRLGLPVIGLGLLAAGIIGGGIYLQTGQKPGGPPAMPVPHVTVSNPLQQTVSVANSFLGQFSAADMVELRAQVGGTLTSINFTDGQIVHKGDLLFTIDPRPYQVRLEQAVAQLQTTQAKKVLTAVELWRAQQLKRSSYGTAETVDQRAADEQAAEAAIASARAGVNDAALDLEYARMTAPFTGRIGTHLVSVGNLVSGSRGGASPTTLLATVVSLDPIYFDFDMSEADYIAFQQAHAGAPKTDVDIALDGDGDFKHRGTLDFIDNTINRGSGTIHLRATVPNHDLALTPGEFARLRVALGKPGPALLVPASAIVPDQSQDTVMVVGDDGKARPRIVTTGALYRGLRIIKSGLGPNDRVIIDGLMLARPGSPVLPVAGTITPDAAG
jgi:multidrug efflux system membrane fusion protein